MRINSNIKLVAQFFLIAAVLLAIGFFAGYRWPRPTYQAGYEQAMDDIAEGQVTVTSAITRARLSEALQAEYDRAVRSFADCTIKDAHAEKCFIPCSTDTDCLQKNGQTDH